MGAALRHFKRHYSKTFPFYYCTSPIVMRERKSTIILACKTSAAIMLFP